MIAAIPTPGQPPQTILSRTMNANPGPHCRKRTISQVKTSGKQARLGTLQGHARNKFGRENIYSRGLNQTGKQHTPSKIDVAAPHPEPDRRAITAWNISGTVDTQLFAERYFCSNFNLGEEESRDRAR